MLVTHWQPVGHKPVGLQPLNNPCPLSLSVSLPTDHLLWRQELPRSLVWVQQWLSWAQHPCQSLQLCASGEWLLGAVREAQLHGLPVHPEQGRVPWLPALDGLQWQRQVLQAHPKRKFPETIISPGEFMEESHQRHHVWMHFQIGLWMHAGIMRYIREWN